ncbi:MAG: CopG family transcriptional regulator [Nitrososphaerota archaeon]
MSEVISFKVSRELKRKVDRLKDVVDWPSELRAFVERRVREVERSEVVRRILEKKPSRILPAGSVVRAIREDRDGA